MVAVTETVAVDTTFLFERSACMFLGVDAIASDGQNNTSAYGFLRSLLRLVKALGSCPIVALATAETFTNANPDHVRRISSILDALGAPVYSRPDEDLVKVCAHIQTSVRAIVSKSNLPLQFVSDGFVVIRPGTDYEQPIMVDADVIREQFGVKPVLIPTFLALTTGPRSSRLTVRQARRLISAHGDLEGIYRGVSDIDRIAVKLQTFRKEIVERYGGYDAICRGLVSRQSKEIPAGRLGEDRTRAISILRQMGCHSLVRLL